MLDESTKSLVNSVFGKCEVALRCAFCKAEFKVESVKKMLDLDKDSIQTLGMSLFGTVGGHVCK